jgi:hypothetical protein
MSIDKIAEGLGTERRGNVHASSGAFGAAQIAANVAEWDKWDIEWWREYHEENRRHAAKIRELMERMRSVVRGEPVPRK